MLLALIFTALAICLIFGEWPGPHRFEVHSETESHQEAEVYMERKRRLRAVDANGTFMTDDLAVYFLKPAHKEIERTREGWLRSLSLRHEKGELTDSEFSEEINKCLDQTSSKL